MKPEIPYIQEADEYQAWAIKTMQGDYLQISNRLVGIVSAAGYEAEVIDKLDLLHALMGICTEAG